MKNGESPGNFTPVIVHRAAAEMWYTLCMNISRRNFLSGIGGLVAVSQLPSLADDPAVFPQRGRYERLSR